MFVLHGFVQATGQQQSELTGLHLGEATDLADRLKLQLQLATNTNQAATSATRNANDAARDGKSSTCFLCLLTMWMQF